MIATGVKTNRPFAGETSRPAWPTPQVSEKRDALPLNPCSKAPPKAHALYASSPATTGAAASAKSSIRRGQRMAIAIDSTAASTTSEWRAATISAIGRPARPAQTVSSSAITRNSRASDRKSTAAGCCQSAWLVDQTDVPSASTTAARNASPSDRRRARTATKNTAAAAAERSDAASLPARAEPVSSRSAASETRANTGAASTAGSTG